MSAAATRRLQELFEKYDTSGDGVLSQEEMGQVLSSLQISQDNIDTIFKNADANEDGTIQVHEFISWLTDQGPKYKYNNNITDEHRTIDATLTNTSDYKTFRFTFTFKNCTKVEFLEGEPTAEFVLQPGEQVTKALLRVPDQAYVAGDWRYNFDMNWHSVFTGVEDDLSNAFIDPDFPHDDSSIGNCSWSTKTEGNLWVRARALGDPREAVLFHQVKPQSVIQGNLSNSWVLGAISALSMFPNKLKSLFNTKQITEDGKYTVTLFDPQKKEWIPVVIDEFLPCTTKYGCPWPEFSTPSGEEIWVMLLEKAFAKLCGSYGNLGSQSIPEAFNNLEEAGQASWALRVLTGNMTLRYAKTRGEWFVCWWMKTQSMEDAWHWSWGRSWYEGRSAEYVWQWLLERNFAKDPSRTISVTWINHMEVSDVDACRGLGLLTGQVYCLLGLCQEELDDGSPIRLVKLRNPWGRFEWNGDWSDFSADGACSAKWTENPKLKAKLLADAKGKNNGAFFMSWEDYSTWFTDVEVGLLEGEPAGPDEDEHKTAFVDCHSEGVSETGRHRPKARLL
mmetsp:Transcript_43957/g.82129  ORF Transcript_43957/g.82129 Transcript_43957/m.82129 type:complete len:562 (-) Transcript_43957:134-1819(-)